MSRRNTTREYCVGINAWSLNVIWVEADSAGATGVNFCVSCWIRFSMLASDALILSAC